MKATIKMIFLIAFSVLAFTITPNVQRTTSDNSTHIESVAIAAAEEMPPETAEPLETAEIAPQTKDPDPPVADNTKSEDPTAPAQVITNDTQPCENFRPMLEKYDWPVSIMLNIMDAETAGSVNGMCDPNATNMEPHYINGEVYCYGSHGLFQISCHDGVVKDPAENIRIAHEKYVSQGVYRAWPYTCKVKVRCE